MKHLKGEFAVRTISVIDLRCFFQAALFALALGGAPAHASDEYPAQEISAQQRCPVCGMYTAQFPDWATQVVFKDHSMIAPESPAELFRFLSNVAKYDPKHTAADIARDQAGMITTRVRP